MVDGTGIEPVTPAV